LKKEKDIFLEELKGRFQHVVDGYYKDVDRASLLFASSNVEDSLTNLLKTFLTDNPRTKEEDDELFNTTNAPLSTFSSKTILAERLKLIDGEFKWTLTMVRKIRNKFAHSAEILEITKDTETKGRIIELENKFKSNLYYNSFKDFVATSSELNQSPDDENKKLKIIFITICSLLIVLIDKRRWELRDTKVDPGGIISFPTLHSE